MKHLYKITLLLLLALLMPATALAYDFEVDGIYYNINGSEATVTDADDNLNTQDYSGNVTIPETVTHGGNTYTVTSIGSQAFYKCSYLTSITIPSSVTSIGDYAFYCCDNLVSITIPEGVTSIGDDAFSGCSGLTSITIPSSVTSIGYRVFVNCSGLASISVNSNNTVYDSRDNCNAIIKKSNNELVVGCKNTIIPSSVSSIGIVAFLQCSGLTSITIPSSVTSIGTGAFSCTGLTSATILAGVTSIGEGAFYCCDSLTSITIPSSVTTIGDNAFSCCSALSSITIPSSVTSIGSFAFSGCSSLTSITIPSSVTNISGCTFLNCSSLTSVTIPEGVTCIGYGAFYYCTSLTSITIPEGVTCIDGYAFRCCDNLSSITIPSSVTNIGSEAFSWCPSLTSITIPEGVTTIGDETFIGCISLSSITIPSSVTSIGNGAFSYCTSLTSITIHSSVTTISDNAFYDCNNLSIMFITGEGEWQAGKLPWGIKTLHIGSEVTGVKGMQANPEKIYSYATTPPVCDENSFTGYDAELHVPASSMAAYFTAPYWCNFTNIIGDAVMATGVTLDQENIKMEVGSQLTLTATIMPESAMSQAVTWTSTKDDVATVNNGVVTAIRPGECDIVATCGDKQAICHVIVVEHLIYITLDQHETRLLPNHLLTLTPTVTPVATDLVVTSSNPAVAAARMAGNKIQVMGITEGTATIYVNSADGYAFSDSCVVTVYTERGDVNCDGFVNISDATSLIDALLDGGNVYSTENADCNNDGKVTITDLTRLIDALLGGTVLPEKERAMAPASLEEMPKSSVPIAIKHWQAGCFE